MTNQKSRHLRNPIIGDKVLLRTPTSKDCAEFIALNRARVKRAGFRKEGYSPRYLKISGRWQDHERWAILAEDWQARPGTTTKLI
jgi:hypothetical protein